MKILHVINSLASGGAEKLIEELVPLMNNIEGLTVDVLLLTNKKSVFINSLLDKGTSVGVLKYNNIYDPRNLIEVVKYIKKGNYNIVHSHIFPTQYWVSLASLFFKNNQIKFVTTEHSTYNRRREKKYFRVIDRFIYSNYDHVISITQKVQDNLLNWINHKHLNEQKYIVIKNGVNLDEINESIPYSKEEISKDFNKSTKLICMIGSFSAAKDQPTLIRALSILPNHFHLLLVGDGKLIDVNRKLTRELDLDNRVHFLGFRQDVPRILKTVDIIVLSSFWEGLSLASIEALASGKPFIASKVQGLEEIISGVGLLFEQGDYFGLSTLIIRLMEDDSENRRITMRCLEESKKYDISKMIDNLLEVYSI